MSNTLEFILSKEGKCPKCGKEIALYPEFDDNGQLVAHGECFKCEYKFDVLYAPLFISKGEETPFSTPAFLRECTDGRVRTALLIDGELSGSVDFVTPRGEVIMRIDVTYGDKEYRDGMVVSLNPEGHPVIHNVSLANREDKFKSFQFNFD